MGKTDLTSSSCSPHSPKTSVTFTNTYINTLHTIASLGGRLPTEARLTQLHVSNSRKGCWAPRNGLHVVSPVQGKPCPSPPLSSGFSLSSMESCRRQVWRLVTWAAGSWAGCADPSHSEHPAEDGGVTAVSEAAGGQAGCARMVGVHNQELLQGPGAQWNPRPRAG